MLDEVNEGEDGHESRCFIDEKVTMQHWARTRRQRVLRDISFESGSPYNIYEPHFTSEDEKSENSLLCL